MRQHGENQENVGVFKKEGVMPGLNAAKSRLRFKDSREFSAMQILVILTRTISVMIWEQKPDCGRLKWEGKVSRWSQLL